YFTKDKGAHWERLIVRSRPDEGALEEAADPVEQDQETGKEVRYIITDNTCIYAAIGKVIYYSRLGERDWKALPGTGLGGYVNFILLSKKEDKLFAATTRGVYEYLGEPAGWERLSSGLPNVNANKLSFEAGGEETLWAATDKGLFRLETSVALIEKRVEVESNLKNIYVTLDNEPSFKELKAAAIRYADVSPQKIKRWYGETRLKALVPKISLGMRKNRSTKSEIYTSATKDYVTVGPDDIDNDLSVSVSWELADLIWSDDMTNIDIRSKLMVQLRNDILEDLRRAYYERKKLLFELAFNPPKDARAKFEKELRLQELTSTIDSLTGDYLSSRKEAFEVRREGI
ncbi:MAG: hypothetical protein ABH875_00875, partial [Candidatus Omnitrophota bacterium]